MSKILTCVLEWCISLDSGSHRISCESRSARLVASGPCMLKDGSRRKPLLLDSPEVMIAMTIMSAPKSDSAQPQQIEHLKAVYANRHVAAQVSRMTKPESAVRSARPRTHSRFVQLGCKTSSQAPTSGITAHKTSELQR